MRFTLVLLVAVLLPISAPAAERIPADEYFGGFFPSEQREAYENSSGSCVYMSTAAAGLYQNVPLAWTLPWDTDYGPACRGGATPSSFERNARERGLMALSVTGSQTYDWMRWAIRNGRWCAIGAGRAHFQTLVGCDEQAKTWDVWNCNDYHHVTRYSDVEFRRLHEASGTWCIILFEYPDAPGNATRTVDDQERDNEVRQSMQEVQK